MKPLSHLGQQFANYVQEAERQSAIRSASTANAEKVHVVGVGGTLTTAYEQLRNAAEYAEEHLLRQRAIRRFYKRVFISRDRNAASKSGEDLVVELTLAGYLENDSVPVGVINTLNELAAQQYDAYVKMGSRTKNRDAWTIDVLSSQAEWLFGDAGRQTAYLQFAYEHFLTSLDQVKLFGHTVNDFETTLFVAVHRTLLKSDNATIRAGLLSRYQQSPENFDAYVKTNKQIDTWFESKTTDKLIRVTDRRGAPLRILWYMLDEYPDIARLLENEQAFLSAYETQIQREYERTEHKINKGIIKSVIFLIITKILIGIAIEIPYDNLVHGSILWLPLAINLLFPAIYMLLLRATLVLPGESNTKALVDQIGSIMYVSNQHVALARRSSGEGFGMAFNVFYGIFFVAIFGGVAYFLHNLGFSAVHLAIFFVFLSTASFLGFRLSKQVRELEVGDAEQNIVSLIRDFLYLPFVTVGRYLSERYARVNLVAKLLDMVIELPLKTVLRLVRQWGAFLSSKKDAL